MQLADLRDAMTQFFDTDVGKKYIEEMERKGKYDIIVNVDDVFQFSTLVGDELLTNGYAIKAIEASVKSIIVTSGGNADPPVQAGLCGTKIPTMLLHQINSEYVSKIIKVRGVVTKTSPNIKPVYREVVFSCSNCGAHTVPIGQDNPFMLMKPLGMCEACKMRPMWTPVDEESSFIDSQEFTIQENQNDITSNRIPAHIKCITYKRFLMNYINCGDEVEVIGMVKIFRPNKTNFTIPYLEALYVNKKSKDLKSIELSDTDLDEIMVLNQDPDVYRMLIRSFAPSIFGHELIKEAILLSMFGAPEEVKEDISIRGAIHILMVGDPSTAKSQLLKAAIKLAPKGMYAMGRGTTAAGLTASLSKNEETNEWEIAAGVLVLADEGIACIDEIDKMREEDRVNIHEAMEQGTVTINKAGIHATLRAKTAVISAANPELGRFEQGKIFDNLGKFPPSLYSRFDLIFTLFDKPNEENDRRVVSHIIDGEIDPVPIIPVATFQKYLIYSKHVNPTLSKEAKEALKDYFVCIRQSSKVCVQKDVPFTYRQFESLKRLALAHARMLLKPQADMDDVIAVKEVFKRYLEDIGYDALFQETGKTSGQRDAIRGAEDLIRMLLEKGNILSTNTMWEEAQRYNIEKKTFFNTLKQMDSSGIIYCPNAAGMYKLAKLPQTTL